MLNLTPDGAELFEMTDGTLAVLGTAALLADVSGTNPGTAQYYTLDLHGSNRCLWDASTGKQETIVVTAVSTR
ncbi:MAG: hypothetical protein HYV27_22315 [Candidatus Hydrogenedentes bacterium]|nr:hypothetical protein [Candidatus Hydrogenedentota bacterium]